MKPFMLISFAASAALTVAACGGGESDSAPSTAPPASDQAAGDSFVEADVTFAQGMIPHHEQAVEMADIALDPTVEAGDDVVALATQIKAAQDPEIEMMTQWLSDWDQPMQMDMSDGHDMSSMDGMMSVEEMGTLSAARGGDFDRMWMEMMIRHHEGAIAMAETVKADSSNPAVTELADAVIEGQQAEIDRMNELLEG